MAKITDLLQKFIMSNPKRAIWFMTSMKPEFWEKQGEKMALKTFHEAAKKVPAYKDFLKKHGIKDHTKIQTIEDFKKYVPVMDKNNYLINYPLEKLTQGKLEESFILSMSGGTTSKPLYILAARGGFKTTYPLGMAAILDYIFDICTPSKKVLLINAVSLGIWAGGITGAFVYKSLADKFQNITLVIPGADQERVIDVLEKIGRYYDLIFIAAYPTFFKTILDAGDKRKIKWEEFNIKLGTGGELLDNSLRDYFIEKISSKRRGLNCIFDVYSGTEVGNPGTSTPLTNKIVSIARTNKNLSSNIFKSEEPLGLFQSNPIGSWVESVNNDIIVTKAGKMPIVRYNVKDIGEIFSWKKMNEILDNHRINIQEEVKQDGWSRPPFQWPFLTVLGRRDYAISLFGAKISPENIQPVFGKDPKIHSFKLTTRDIEDLTPHFVVLLELQPSVELQNEGRIQLQRHYKKKILNHLLRTNFDFKDAYSIRQETLIPKIKIYSFREGPFREEKNRIKPKLII